jgi:hypothetical protein
MVLERLKRAGLPNVCDKAFSAMARPILPFPSSKGWMDSKYKWAMADLTGAFFIYWFTPGAGWLKPFF